MEPNLRHLLTGRFPSDALSDELAVDPFEERLQAYETLQRKLQKYTSFAEHGRPQTEAYHHIEHCLDSLLMDMYYHADETPWYELPSWPARARYDPY